MSNGFPWSRQKVFCVGRNKTGTTSLLDVMTRLGYRSGDQPKAELLLEDWARGDFDAIGKHCRRRNFFQDIPFSLPGTFQAMDRAFPKSRFILTVRSNAEEWYESLVRFHTKLIGAGRVPTAEDLRAFKYRAPGWLWRTQELVYGVDEDTLYDRDHYIQHYERHNESIRSYFQGRPGDLLKLDLSQPKALEKLCGFLGRSHEGLSMPHLNRSL